MSNLLKQRGIRESEGRRYAASRRSKGRLEDLLCRVWWFLLTSECEYDNYYLCISIVVASWLYYNMWSFLIKRGNSKYTTKQRFTFLYDNYKNGVKIHCFVLIDCRQTKECWKKRSVYYQRGSLQRPIVTSKMMKICLCKVRLWTYKQHQQYSWNQPYEHFLQSSKWSWQVYFS